MKIIDFTPMTRSTEETPRRGRLYRDGVVIHKSTVYAKKWVISHLDSRMRITPRHFLTMKQARAACEYADQQVKDVDWTTPLEDIRTDIDSPWKAWYDATHQAPV